MGSEGAVVLMIFEGSYKCTQNAAIILKIYCRDFFLAFFGPVVDA